MVGIMLIRFVPRRTLHGLLWAAVLVSAGLARAQDAPSPLTADLVRPLQLRALGPALTPGRVSDITVDPRDRKVWYVAAASGGLWKTINAGATCKRPMWE